MLNKRRVGFRKENRTIPVPGMVVSEFVAARLAVKMLAYHRLRDRIRTDCAES